MEKQENGKTGGGGGGQVTRGGVGEGGHEGPLLSSPVSIHTQIPHFSQLKAFIALHEKEALGQ